MKAILILFLSMALFLPGWAQQRQGCTAEGQVAPGARTLRSAGDTLLYMDGRDLQVVAAADTADFVLVNLDVDQLSPNNPAMDGAFTFGLFSTDSSLLLPGDADTAWFFGATSWFSPPGRADNWLVMGPVTIPAGGADLSWYHRHNRGWTDSYELYVTEEGPQPYTQIDPDSVAPYFAIQQLSYPAFQPGQDTLWTHETVQLHAFAGKRVFISFRHTANDGDMLYLDEILVVENDNIGLTDISRPNLEIYPNPASELLTIRSGADLILHSCTVRDLGGRMIAVQMNRQGSATLQVGIEDLAPGIYIIEVWTGRGIQARKFVVQ